MKTFSFLCLVLLIGLFSCQPTDNTAKTTVDKNENSTANEVSLDGDNKYKLTAFEPSAEYYAARLENMSFENSKFSFDVSGGKYKLGNQTPDAGQKKCANSAKGQHIHLIVDDKPYAAKYTSEFDYEIEDGMHYILAFLSRSYHESIKSQISFIAKETRVENNSITKGDDITSPMMFYSRPKGTYTGKAETDKVMLDFFLINTNLGGGKKVQANINGEKHMIDVWQPYYIEGLPMGENSIELTLLDATGQKMNIPLNPVSRTFTLKEDPLEN